MPISKYNISAPLEAGSSILEPTQIPSELYEPLNYISSQLVRKRLHLSLIVVRKDSQIRAPIISPCLTTPNSQCSITPSSTCFNWAQFSTLARTKSSTSASASSTSSISLSASTSSISQCSTSTAASSISTSTIYLSRTKWSGLPSSPKDSIAHHTPGSQSPISTPSSSPPPELTHFETLNRYGITLMHSSMLTPRAERILRRTIARAEHKFPFMGSNWLSTTSLSSPIDDLSTQELIRRSLAQNNIVFMSDGLSLYSLDYVYTFKCALNTYCRSLSREDLRTAVDELRRLALVQKGRRVTKGYLMRCYEQLGISLSALVDVDEAYKNHYGGITRQGAIEIAVGDPRSPPHLKTTFGTEVMVEAAEYLVEVGESAKGRDGESPIWEKGMLGAGCIKEDRGPFLRGKKTPNGEEDCSPWTKNEWRSLILGE